MVGIEWKASYETRIESLDNEHRGLVDQINRLFQAILNKEVEEQLLPIFDELVTYTKQHFQHEEALLAEYNYPELESQQVEHKQLTQQVLDYRQKLEGGTAVSAQEVMGFLRKWLLEHIVKHDMKYGSYLESRGGRFID